MHMSDTKEIDLIINELKNSQWFAKFLPSLTDVSTDVSKQIFKCIHQIDILRHKGIKKSALLAQKIKSVRNKYRLRHIQLVTGISYSNVQRLLNAGEGKKCKSKITEQDRMSITHVVLQTVHSMQILYRQFAKYFYLRESIHDTYKAYVAEQKQYGLRVLSESAMYKNLPKFVCSQKYIPFIECLCVKCLNFSLLVDALRVAGITVRRRAILNVIASICLFLVDKDAVDKIPEVLPQENTEKKNAKSTMIQFGAIDHIEYEAESFKFIRKSSSTVSNNSGKEYKHDPNKFLLGFANVPENLPVEILIRNALIECIFWNCSNCGVHKFFKTLCQMNLDIS